ncbi:hypothetical protein [Streptomyces sp. NPDC018584]|uniref:hypothetical protein n=1 Tax=unclassified Streptomyces TaxID=2593676 RepID=UPI0037B7FE43
MTPAGDNAAYLAAPADDPLAHLAVTVEAMFLAQSSTLTDDATAAAYAITLDAMVLLLSGARAKGVLSGQAFEELSAMIAEMRNAPQLL